MKEYLTMKEAGLLLGKTTKTIKNYIKRGVIKNFFLVDGKYGQEYKISVRDLEPLGITCLDVLREDFTVEGKKNIGQSNPPGETGNISGEMKNVSPVNQGNVVDSGQFVARFEEMVLDMGKSREKITSLAEEITKLKQDLEEKNMLIQVLMKKKEQP